MFKEAKWDGLRCGARSRRTGEPCRNLRVAGATRCRMHGGRKLDAAQKLRPGASLDWFAIRLLYTLGHSPLTITRIMPKRDGKPVVARQVIARRAAKEGWGNTWISHR